MDAAGVAISVSIEPAAMLAQPKVWNRAASDCGAVEPELDDEEWALAGGAGLAGTVGVLHRPGVAGGEEVVHQRLAEPAHRMAPARLG